MADAKPYYSPSTDEALLACTASAWQGTEGQCRWCAKPLTGRRTRWCSDACSAEFGRNHFWTWASHAAKRRDNQQCTECRCDPREARDRALAEGLSARLARRYIVLQVHHKVPVLGRHAEGGCHHHLAGLETLCLHHHLGRHHGLQTHQLRLT